MARRMAHWFVGAIATAAIAVVAACGTGLMSPASSPQPIVGKLASETETKRATGALTGQFIVATPRIQDPRFAHTVIFIVSHDEKGAMGLVVNRAFGEGSLHQLLAGFGVTDLHTAESVVRLYYGGPVEPERGFVLHSPDYRGPSTQEVEDGVSLSTGKDVLEAIAAGHGPADTMFIIGYAGWGAGQLERELARDDWLTAPVNPSLIFNDHPELTWSEVYREAGLII